MPISESSKPNVLFLNSCVSGGGAGRSLLAYLGLDSPKINTHIVLPEAGILTRHLKHKEQLHFVQEFIERPLVPPYRWMANLPVINALGGVFSLFRSASRISAIVRSQEIDVIYCNHMLANPVGVVVGMALNIPVVFHIRNIHNNLWIERWFYRLMAKPKIVKALICNSRASAEPFMDLVPEKVSIIHNFCDLEHFDRRKVNPRLRKELGIDPSHKVVGYVGRITGWKGIDLLVEAFAKLVKSQPDTHLVIVGENDGGIKVDLKAQYQQLAQSLGIGKRIHFVGFKDDTRPYVADFDVLALPSRSPEPFGRVLVEAMAMGVPAVISAHGGAIEVVQDGVDGYWFNPCDINDMSSKLEMILQLDTIRREMGKTVRQTVKEKFDDRMLSGHITRVIYRSAATRKGFEINPEAQPVFG